MPFLFRAHLPCCALIFFSRALTLLCHYPALRLPFCALIFFSRATTLLCHYLALRLPCCALFFFFRAHLFCLSRALLLCLNFFHSYLPCCALIFFRVHLPCCALNKKNFFFVFASTYFAVPLCCFALTLLCPDFFSRAHLCEEK